MVVLPLPKKLDRKARFRAHMKEFFAGYVIGIDNIITRAQITTQYDLTYITEGQKPMVDEGIDNWINTLSVLLDDDSYIVKYPNFYLPITANKPEVLLLADMKVGNNTGYGFYGNLSNILAINVKNINSNPRDVLITTIHEYAHKQVRIDEILPTGVLAIESTIASWFDSGFGDWAVGSDNQLLWHTKVMTYAKIRSVGDVNHYPSYMEWLDEIAVRLKSNVALNNQYHDLDTFWERGFATKTSVVNEIFTEKYQNYLKAFAWPDQPKLKKVLNK